MAIQLTNIARDVGENAREGRLYLPYWLDRAAIDPDALLAGATHEPDLGAVITRLLRKASRPYTARGRNPRLPLSARPAISTAG